MCVGSRELQFPYCVACAEGNHLPSLGLCPSACSLASPLASFHDHKAAVFKVFTSQSQRDPRTILHITLTFSLFESLEYSLNCCDQERIAPHAEASAPCPPLQPFSKGSKGGSSGL